MTAPPPLCDQGTVLWITAHFPPRPTAASTVHGNLLAAFAPSSYRVATCTVPEKKRYTPIEGVQIDPVQYTIPFSRTLDLRGRTLQAPWSLRRLRDLVERHDITALAGVYPDYHFLYLARQTARTTGLPWIAYLHDLLAENMQHTPLRKAAARLQQQVFDEADQVFVMSEGMADLIQYKYGRAVSVLAHTYPESIETPSEPVVVERQALWSGRIYGINTRAVQRIARALQQLDCPLVVTTPKPPAALVAEGLEGDHIRTVFYAERAAYLTALRTQRLLLNAIDWPDESEVHADELATIFPTKTPEYLAAGRPMLVHCPAHYYLARFVQQHGCGLVVSERSGEALREACAILLSDSSDVRRMQQAARRAAQHFVPAPQAHRLKQALNRITAV